MSGRLKKMIWLILMTELVVLHIAVLARLYLFGHRTILILFLGGSLVMASVQYLTYRTFVKNCAKHISRLENEKIIESFEEVLQESGNKKEKVRVYENSQTVTPFVMGIFHPSIILPKECEQYSRLKLILLHECFHVKRKDTLYKYIMLVANCFLWFHPLAYLIRYISYQDIEISCDESVTEGKTREERLEYGEFLVASVQNMQTKSNAFHAYWNSSKSILKHRIDAIINENRKWDWLAKAAIVFFVLEAVVLSILLTKNILTDYEKATAPVNEYAEVIAPQIYSDEAIQQMLLLEPVEENTYCLDMTEPYDNQFPEKEFAEIEAQAHTPWQIKMKRPAHFGDAADIAIQRLYFYLENQTAYSSTGYEEYPFNTTYELVYRTLLAGDIDNSVWSYIWKVYCSDPLASESVQNGYAFVKEGEPNYLYFTTAVQMKMVEPYLFEAVGYANMYQVMDAYEQKYETEIFHYIPQVMSFSSGTGTEIDLELQDTLANAFAEVKGMGDVRISFPENNQEGYLLGITDKAAMQVYCVLYKTEDGGKSWKKVQMDSTGTEHRQTYDFSFVSDKEGYIALYSFFEESPCMLRTEDGGVTWEPVQFSEEKMDFCQAFPPVYDGEKYIVYVGKEGSSVNKGEKACYESADEGKTWEYTGQVTFD